ncbi:DUF1542 domain-containing protein [Lactobacillus panisapium]|uniref:DUF1542 domain-containing protein n=1 Tax=Lactobacillus panisapium TaxID=2012495 RepID=A0ABX8WDR9_9LACO|nr:DUF1542 domain-containing protein [Lactobacillus panisapium]QYN53296.1 DUF1542 domain-containing protein [Lactobacillus panisapium]
MKKPNLIEDVKNTNYKMHKGKKGWTVSYSLLTFMLGGIFYGNTSAQQVNAADIGTKTTQLTKQDKGQQEVESKSIDDARTTAGLTLDTEATSTKNKINTDANLTNKEKAAQIETIDSLVANGKARIAEATELVSIKAIVDQAVANINSSYKPGSVISESKPAKNNKTNSTTKVAANTKKAPTINEAKKPASKKVAVSTYQGLSSFFKEDAPAEANKPALANTNTNNSSSKDNNKEETSSLIAPQDKKVSAASLQGKSITTKTDEEVEANTDATVAPDPDAGREDFEDLVKKPSGKTRTSINVPVPKEVTNPDTSQSADVSTFAQLADAWGNSAVTYINITQDIAFDSAVASRAGGFGTRGKNARTPATSVVINGNGHKIDMGNQSLRVGNYRVPQATSITVTNAKFTQSFTSAGGAATALLSSTYAGNGPLLTFNIDNVELEPSAAGTYSVRGVVAYGAKIVFSGDNKFVITNEVARGMASVYFANDASVQMVRNSNDFEDDNSDGDGDDGSTSDPSVVLDRATPEFAFNRGNGNKNQFIMGDRSSNLAATLNGVSTRYPALQGSIMTLQVGDDVSWTQKGFAYFLLASNGAAFRSASYVFGQNFDLECPSATRGGVIHLYRNQSLVFNPGTILDINQQVSNDSIIVVAGTSSVTFNSPRELDLAITNKGDAAATARRGIVSGSGTVKINNSSIRTWDGLNSSEEKPDGDYSAKFSNITITNGVATISVVGGNATSSNILTATTRELKTNAIKPGKVKIEYIDRQGNNIGEYELPFGNGAYEDAYIGKRIPLVSEDIVNHIPEGYMWALGNQIYSGAAADQQSGGAATDEDNGDASGQPNVAIVPMDDGSFTYKVYVYGTKQNVTYKYVDVNHPDKVLTIPKLAGTEDTSGLVTANYGNTIDWTNKYYTQTNVPVGYHYKTDAENQPTTTLVSNDNPVVILYVEGDEQKIVPTYVDGDGNAITPDNPVEITGRTGDTITIPTAPDVKNLAVDEIYLNGNLVTTGSSFEMPDQAHLSAKDKYTIVYKYRSLQIDKDEAIKAIETAANNATEKISINKTWTTAGKENQSNKVIQAKIDAINEINNCETLSQLNSVKDKWIEEINKLGDENGKPLETQKTDAKGLIDDKAKEVKDQIDTDVTLTNAKKAEQKADVDKAVADAKTAIDNAEDAQGIEDALNKGREQIGNKHRPESLTQQQTDAKSAIDGKAKEVKDKIDADKTLTNAQKTDQKDAVDQAAAAIKDAIDKAEDAQTIEDTLIAGKDKIDAVYKPGDPISSQKEAAKGKIDDKVKEVKGNIDADKNLTDAEKEKQKTDVDKAAADAKDAIDKADTAQGVQDALNKGIDSIGNAYVPGGPLSGQKTDAKGRIDDKAKEVKGNIDADKNLTDKQKAEQKDAVDQAAVAAKENIDLAETAQGVKDALDKGIDSIGNAYVPGGPLSAQKIDAKGKIDDKAKEVKGNIDADKNLTDKQKAEQKDAVDQAAVAAKENIDLAETAQGIENALNIGKDKIDAAYKPGSSLTGQKTDAKGQIDDKAKEVKGKIDADKNLTDKQKVDQKAEVDQAAADAKDAIDKAETAQGVEDAVTTGKANIDAAYKPGGSLSGQKTEAKGQIDDKAKEVKGNIDADKNLTDKQKAEQKDAVDKAASDAKDAIDKAETAQAVEDAVNTGKDKIDAAHKPGSSLSGQKTDAKGRIDDKAKEVKGNIDADKNLTDKQKAEQKDAVDKAAVDAKDAIDKAETAQGVEDAVTTGKANIDAAYKPGSALSGQKTDAKGQIDDKAKEVKGNIDADKNLTDKQKADQKADVDKAASDAKDAIDQAETAQAVEDAVTTGKDKIGAAYKPGSSLTGQKTDAKGRIDDKAKEVKGNIDADKNLTDKQKSEQKADVDKAASDAKDAIDKAETAQAVEEAVTTGKANIDAVYKPGSALSGQKTDAKGRIDDKVKEVKDKIDADNNLTDKQKADQKADVDKAASAAKDAIDQAETAQAVEDAVTIGKANIDAAYKPGSSLTAQKTDAKGRIDDKVKEVKDKIDADKNLTDKQKTDQKAAVDQAAADAKDAINKADTAQAVEEAVTTGKANIDAAYKPGSALSGQKTDAKGQIDDKAKEVKGNIDADKNLTDKQKADQKADVDKAASDAKDAIDKAETAQAVEDAVTTGKANIDAAYKPGSALGGQKTDAKGQIDDKAKEVKDKIDADVNLTDKQKTDQKDAVDKAVSDAKDAIDKADTAQGVQDALNDGKDKIDAIYAPGSSLSGQKTEAKGKIDDKAKEVKGNIDADKNLTDKQKADQKDAVDKAAADAKDAIDQAKTAQAIEDAVTTGKANIDAAYKPGSSLTGQKTDAKGQIDDKAKEVKGKIDGDKNLTDKQKADQKADVDQAVTDAKNAIDQAETAQAVEEAVTTGKANIDAAYKPGSSITGQKTDAKGQIDDKVKEVKGNIEADKNLTDKQKTEQKDALDKAAADAKDAIDQAETAQAIEDAVTTGKANIDAAYKPGTPISNQKTTAKGQIDDKAKEVKGKIDADKNLTDKQKTEQKADVDQAVTEAKNAIDQAETAQAVEEAVTTGKANIDAAYKPGTPISNQKTTAKGQIDDKAKEVKGKIDADNNLTDKQKSDQKEAVDKAATDAKDAIDQAETAQAVEEAVTTGKANIDAAYKPGSPVSGQKTAAKGQIDDKAKEVKDKIDADKNLTDKQKADQKADVDKAASDAKGAIDKAETAQAVEDAVTTGKDQIEAAYKPGTSLSGQKTAAKGQIDDKAKEVKDKIDSDKNLTDKQKADQKVAVDKAVTDAKDAIDKAETAQAVEDAVTTGKANIEAAYKPGSDISNQKTEAKGQIDDKAKEVKDKIDADKNLTDKQKSEQKDAVDKAAADAKDAINKAETAQEVQDAINKGKDQIDAAYKPGSAIGGQKTDAKSKIDDKVKEVKGKIDADKNLTDKQKADQKADVDQAAADAKNAIDQAETAQAVEDAVTTGKANIDAAYKPGSSLSGQKTDAKGQIDDKGKEVKDKIDADKNLTDKQKADQKLEVDKAVSEAKDAIDKAGSAQEVQDALNKGKDKIDAAYKPGTVITDQKDKAKDKINETVKDVKDKIDADKNLTDAEKEKQKADADKAAADAKDAIDKAETAQEVQDAVNKGNDRIENAYKPGTALTAQKSNAKDRIDDEADTIKDLIAKDRSLTDKAKADQVAAVDAAAQTAKNRIDAATTAQEVQNAVDRGIKNIDSKYVTNPITLAEQKEYAQQLIRDEAEIVKGQIESDPALDTETKAQQAKAVDAQVQKAINKIAQAPDAQAVQEEYNNGIIAIHAQHLKGTELETQKQKAKDSITQELTTIKEAISKDVSLVSSEKAKQIADAELAAGKAQNAIDRANKAQDISDNLAAGIIAIDNAYIPGKPLADQKSEANKALDDAAAAAKDKIDKDQSKTAEEKANEKQKIDDAVSKAKDAIDKAKDADGVNNAKIEGTSEIEIAQKPTATVEDQKNSAKKEIDDAANAAKNKISQDVSLTNEQKAAANKAVDDAAAAAKDAIDKASNSDEINKAKQDGINAIDKITAELDLQKLKDQSKAIIIDSAQAAKNKIDNIANVSDGEKQSAKEKIDQILEAGKANIDKANSFEEILQVIDRTNKEIGLVTVVPNNNNSNGSDGAGSNGSGSNGSDGAGSNGSGSNGSDGAGGNGSGSNGSDGAGSNGSGSNGSDGAGSNGSGSNGSDGAGSNGSGSNGSDGAGSNGSGSNGSDGAGSNGSVPNGSDGAGSNGSGSNGSDGAGSNGSGSNGSDGAGSNGSGSNGSDDAGSNGSGSNGSDGAGSNSSGSNGSDGNGSGSNGSDGAGSNGSGSNGSNGSGSGSSNGSGSTGSGSNSSGSGSSNGSGSTSTGSNGSGSTVNNPATSEGTAAATAGEETGDAVDRKLNHNAYFYNKDGKRANLLVAKKGSVISTYKQESINGRDFYLTDNGLYVAVNNFKEQTRLLKKNAFLYSSKGKRISTKLLKKNTKVKTYGDPVTIKGKQYYITTGNRYVKAANFAVAAKEANNVVADGVTANAILEHDAYIYNDEGKRINRVVLKAGSQLATGETKTIDGRQFIEIGKGHYVASDNVTGTARKLSTKAYVYDQHGQRIGKQTLKKNDTVQTYGEPVKKGGQEFYIIGNNKFVKKGVVK